MQQLKGIHTIDNSEKKDHSLECWVLDCGEGVVLVDGGMTPQHVDNIAAELKSMKKGWKDVEASSGVRCTRMTRVLGSTLWPSSSASRRRCF